VALAVGRAIAARRRSRGLSQSRLAEVLAVDHSVVSRWELGTRTPGVHRLLAIARALDCDPARLLPE